MNVIGMSHMKGKTGELCKLGSYNGGECWRWKEKKLTKDGIGMFAICGNAPSMLFQFLKSTIEFATEMDNIVF